MIIKINLLPKKKTVFKTVNAFSLVLLILNISFGGVLVTLNQVNADATCVCGDGVIDIFNGEECDSGNNCNSSCKKNWWRRWIHCCLKNFR